MITNSLSAKNTNRQYCTCSSSQPNF